MLDESLAEGVLAPERPARSRPADLGGSARCDYLFIPYGVVYESVVALAIGGTASDHRL
jgi:hypothetical protein